MKLIDTLDINDEEGVVKDVSLRSTGDVSFFDKAQLVELREEIATGVVEMLFGDQSNVKGMIWKKEMNEDTSRVRDELIKQLSGVLVEQLSRKFKITFKES